MPTGGIFGIGFWELAFIAVIALIVLGPKRLPGVIREIAKFIGQMRAIGKELTSQFSEELELLDDVNPQKIFAEVGKIIEEEAAEAEQEETEKEKTEETKKDEATKPQKATDKPLPKKAVATSTSKQPASSKGTVTDSTDPSSSTVTEATEEAKELGEAAESENQIAPPELLASAPDTVADTDATDAETDADPVASPVSADEESTDKAEKKLADPKKWENLGPKSGQNALKAMGGSTNATVENGSTSTPSSATGNSKTPTEETNIENSAENVVESQ